MGQAILSPFHAAALAAIALTALCTQSPLPLVCGAPIAEALIVMGLPRWRVFRSAVDKQREKREREERDAWRAQQLYRVSEVHRQSIRTLEELAAAIRARLPASNFDWSSIDRLIETYVHIAVIHDEAAELLADTRAWIEPVDVRAADTGGRHRALALRLRASRVANEERLAVLAEQLTTIEGTLRLLHERTIIVLDPEQTTAAIDGLLAEIEENMPVAETLRSLSGSV